MSFGRKNLPATQLQAVAISAVAPSTNQVLTATGATAAGWAAAGGGGIPEQSVPAYPTVDAVDTDRCHDTSQWTSVGASAWNNFTSDGFNIYANAKGASQTCRSRFTLTNTKAAAFDVSLLLTPGFLLWSSNKDTVLNIYLRTSAGTGITSATLSALTSPLGGGTGPAFELASSIANASVQGLIGFSPVVVRFLRDGSNNVTFQSAPGPTPYVLMPAVNTGDNSIATGVSAGTLARIELEVVTPASYGASAIAGFKLDWLQSL